MRYIANKILIKKTFTLYSRSITYKGPMDFDADHKDTGIKEKATIGLVFMFQPLTDIYTQPVTVVASKGSIICTELAKLMIKCIILLEHARANVHHIVSYQIKTNRKMWTELEVSEKMTLPKIVLPLR